MERQGIKVKGHIGTWYVVDEGYVLGRKLYLLEHETYGEDAPWICVDGNLNVVLEDIHNGFDDVDRYFENKQL